MIRNLLLSNPRKARDDALWAFTAAKLRGDTRAIHQAYEAAQEATNRLLLAERRWGWVRV